MTQLDRERYAEAMHGVQTAIAWEMHVAHSTGGRHGETEPKHLRVGVNSALVSNGAVAQLLVEKGIFTLDELDAALANVAERELASYMDRNPGMRFG